MENSKELYIKRLQAAFEELSKRGMTFKNVNEMLISVGLSDQHASNIKNGKKPGAKLAEKLLTAFRINPAFIQFGHQPILLNPVANYDDTLEFTKTEQQTGINADEKQTVINQMQHRINDLQHLITQLEKSLDDKDKIIRLLEERK